MAIFTTYPPKAPEGIAGSPPWWRDVLAARLDARAEVVALCEGYYEGHHRLSFGTPLWQDAFRAMLSSFADNWLALVVDSAVERLQVQGFRFGPDADADDDAWAIWQANALDLGSRMAHTHAVTSGESFALVATEVDGTPQITIEHPAQAIVARDPADRRQRLAGLKRWCDDFGRWYATVYMPAGIYRWQATEIVPSGYSGIASAGPPGGWEPRTDDDGPILDNPIGVVPLVALENNPRLLAGGRSDILGLIPLQDAIDKIVCDSLVASEYSALRQRWLTGSELPKDAAGQPLPRAQIEATFRRIWVAENPEAKWGEFSVADLTGYVSLASMLRQDLAAQSRTPPHYLLGQIVNASGDALKAAEATLVKKVRAKMVDFAEGWEEVMRLAFRYGGDERRGSATDAETIWADPETRTESEHVDALVKKTSIGVPNEMLWEEAGYTPQQIERMRGMVPPEPATPPAPPGATPVPPTPPPTEVPVV